MVLVMPCLRTGKGRQDPLPPPSADRSPRGRVRGHPASLALAPNFVPFLDPWRDDRLQERVVCCLRLVESAVAQKPNPRVWRKFRSIKTIYFAANDFGPL